jgi:hypothetical protein
MIFGEVFYATFLLATLLIYLSVNKKFRLSVIAISGVGFYVYYAGQQTWLLFLMTLSSWFFLFYLPSYYLQLSGSALDFGSKKTQELPLTFDNQYQHYVKLASLSAIFSFIFILGYFKYGNLISSIFTKVEEKILVFR